MPGQVKLTYGLLVYSVIKAQMVESLVDTNRHLALESYPLLICWLAQKATLAREVSHLPTHRPARASTTPGHKRPGDLPASLRRGE